jgi:hypothetical protein
MMPFANLQVMAAGIFLMFGLAMLHLGWQKVRRWPRLTGRVIGHQRVMLLKCPEIEYELDGTTHRFISQMPWKQRMKPGSDALLIVEPGHPENAERFSYVSAIGGPLVMILFGVLAVLSGLK